MRPNCNNCSTNCRGMRLTSLQNMLKYKNIFNAMLACKEHTPPIEGWKLAELVLAHPSSLNRALSALPFKIFLMDYFKMKGVA